MIVYLKYTTIESKSDDISITGVFMNRISSTIYNKRLPHYYLKYINLTNDVPHQDRGKKKREKFRECILDQGPINVTELFHNQNVE